MVKKIDRLRKISIALFFVVFMVQIGLFSYLQSETEIFNSNISKLESVKAKDADTLMNSVIRPQMRTMLTQVRTSWVEYLANNPTTLLLKDTQGKLIYSNDKGKTLSFNPDTMIRENRTDKYYDIRDLSGNVLIDKARPEWNSEKVKEILNVIVRPMRAFGPTGDVIIFDSYTGEMIIDDSEDCKDTPQVLGADGKRYITLDYKHPSTKNVEANKAVIQNEFMWRKDSDATTKMIYFFNEPTNMGKEANDFSKYPLGKYNREFQEKIVLPYPTVGVEGQDMQITIVLGAQEQEIMSSLNNNVQAYDKLVTGLKSSHSAYILIPIISLFLNFVVILVAVFGLNVSMVKCMKQ